MFKFEELNVYVRSKEFVIWVYKLTETWPKREIYSLTDQLRRAATSICLNIAEGTSRSNKDFGHFLDMVRGSVFECVAIADIAIGNEYFDQNTYKELYSKCEELSKMTNSLKRAVVYK